MKFTLIQFLVMAAVTALLRFLPFLVFPGGRKRPQIITYLGTVLPYSVMAMLVIYCLKDGVTDPLHTGFQEAAGVGVTAASYIWKHNTLLSILLGTVTYMLAIRFLPV